MTTVSQQKFIKISASGTPELTGTRAASETAKNRGPRSHWGR